MTATTTEVTGRPRRPEIDHGTAMRLAETEYGRFQDVLRGLTPAEWTAPTDCTGWDVRAIAGHLLGEMELAASFLEQRRQVKAATAAGGSFLDALTALQVDEHRALSTGELVKRFASTAPKAVRGRRRTPGLVRRTTVPQKQRVGGVEEQWTVGYLLDVIFTRDPWMHRIDICRAVDRTPVLTADHDGVLVEDIAREWLQRHGEPVTLRLTGPAGCELTQGAGGPELELDAVEFCRVMSQRAPGVDLLAYPVPF